MAFLSVEGKTNTLHVNISFTENLLFGIGRYCGKVFPEPTDFHLFWASAFTKNDFLIYVSGWPLVNKSRIKRVSAFFYDSLVLKQLIFNVFFKEIGSFRSTFFFFVK